MIEMMEEIRLNKASVPRAYRPAENEKQATSKEMHIPRLGECIAALLVTCGKRGQNYFTSTLVPRPSMRTT